jgi:hypothetical protein
MQRLVRGTPAPAAGSQAPTVGGVRNSATAVNSALVAHLQIGAGRNLGNCIRTAAATREPSPSPTTGAGISASPSNNSEPTASRTRPPLTCAPSPSSSSCTSTPPLSTSQLKPINKKPSPIWPSWLSSSFSAAGCTAKAATTPNHTHSGYATLPSPSAPPTSTPGQPPSHESSTPTTPPYTSPRRRTAFVAKPLGTAPPAMPSRVCFASSAAVYFSFDLPQTLPSALSWNETAGAWCPAPPLRPVYELPPPLSGTALASSPATSLPGPYGPAVPCPSFLARWPTPPSNSLAGGGPTRSSDIFMSWLSR